LCHKYCTIIDIMEFIEMAARALVLARTALNKETGYPDTVR